MVLAGFAAGHVCAVMRHLSVTPDGRAFEFKGCSVLPGTTGS